jgi:hypothetical protein
MTRLRGQPRSSSASKLLSKRRFTTFSSSGNFGNQWNTAKRQPINTFGAANIEAQTSELGQRVLNIVGRHDQQGVQEHKTRKGSIVNIGTTNERSAKCSELCEVFCFVYVYEYQCSGPPSSRTTQRERDVYARIQETTDNKPSKALRRA